MGCALGEAVLEVVAVGVVGGLADGGVEAVGWLVALVEGVVVVGVVEGVVLGVVGCPVGEAFACGRGAVVLAEGVHSSLLVGRGDRRRLPGSREAWPPPPTPDGSALGDRVGAEDGVEDGVEAGASRRGVSSRPVTVAPAASAASTARPAATA